MKIRDRFKEQTGFTIIEVMIVLAIAAVIMLIVFLAIPALQRNSRNTQRSNDAARTAGAINECMANNSGNISNCDFGASGVAGQEQLQNYIDMADNQQLTVFTPGTLGAAMDNVYYRSGYKCDGNNEQAGGGSRAFILRYNVETSAGTAARCVGS